MKRSHEESEEVKREWRKFETRGAWESAAWGVLIISFFALVILFAVVIPSCYAGEPQVDMTRIAMIESSGNPLAHNKRDDSRGLYQITPICLREFNNFHPTKQYSSDDLWNPIINREIARWYINTRIPQMLKHYKKPVTIENIIISFNAGVSYVVEGKTPPKITQDYLRKYREQ